MAKKKKPEIATVPMTDPNEVAGNAANLIGTIGRTAQQTDVQTGRAGTAAFARDIMQGGLSAVDPAAARAINQFEQANRVTGKDLAEQGRLQRIVNTGKNSAGKQLSQKQIERARAKLETLSTRITTRQQAVEDFTQRTIASSPSAASVMRQADPEFYANVDRAQGFADQIGQMSPEGQRFLDAAGRGYQAGAISSRDVAAERVSAPRMGDFGRATSRDISAAQVGAGMLGQSLMQRAMSGVQGGGRLSGEASRDAVQAARQGFAARGLATGSAALGAELLNRDRFRRQREMEDLQFASGVQAQDLGRQFNNVGNQLTADQANQSAAMQAELANLQARYNAAVQQGNWDQATAFQNQATSLQAAISNADRSLNAAVQNEQARRLGTITNNEMLYNAAGYVDGQRAAGLGASLQMAGVQQSANPLFRLLGQNPYAGGYGSQAVGPGSQLAGGVAQLNAGANEFNANATNWANYANAFQPSFQSGTGSTIGSIAGGLLGGAAGYFASAGNPMFAMGGYMAGSQIGGGIGQSFR